MKIKFVKINESIIRAQNILIVTHPKPDGDALGSTCAMIGYLKALGKNYRAFCVDSIPQQFLYLPWQEEIQYDYSRWYDFEPDLVIFLDLFDWERSGIKGFLDSIGQPKTIILDHHKFDGQVPELSIIDTKYSSTAEILTRFFIINNFSPKKPVADSLLTGILTDTENFTNQSSSELTLKTASLLMKWGANFDRMTQKTFRFRKFDDLRLMGLALNRLQINKDLDLAVTIIKKSDLDRLELGEDPLTGFTNFLKGLTSCKAVLLLVEENGTIKGSFRSVDPQVDVSKLAKVLGGGGHKLAAGFSLPGVLEKIGNNWKVV